MTDEVREVLRKLVRERGAVLLDDPQKVQALMADLCPSERAKRYVIVAALEQGVPQQLRTVRNIATSHVVNRVADQLRLYTGIGASECSWAVDSISYAMSTPGNEEVRPSSGKSELRSPSVVMSRPKPGASNAPGLLRIANQVSGAPLSKSPAVTGLSRVANTVSSSPIFVPPSQNAIFLKRACGVLIFLSGLGSLVIPFFVMWVALGHRFSGSTPAANILGIPCFILLVIVLIKVVPASIRKASEFWK